MDIPNVYHVMVAALNTEDGDVREALRRADLWATRAEMAARKASHNFSAVCWSNLHFRISGAKLMYSAQRMGHSVEDLS